MLLKSLLTPSKCNNSCSNTSLAAAYSVPTSPEGACPAITKMRFFIRTALTALFLVFVMEPFTASIKSTRWNQWVYGGYLSIHDVASTIIDSGTWYLKLRENFLCITARA